MSRPYASAVSQCRLQRTRTFRSSATARIQVMSRKKHEGSSDQDSAFLRVTIRDNRRLQSPAEILAIIRSVERKYGRIVEYHFSRDHELPNYYQNMAQITFADPASWKRIPESSESLMVTLPRTDLSHSGGVGLDTLKELLLPEQIVEESSTLTFGDIMEDISNDGDKEKIQVSVKIQRSKSFFGISKPTGRLSNILSASFIRWGGFHPLKPIPAETPLPTQLTVQSATVDHVAMRWALRFHSDMLRVQNPYEIRADQSISESGTDESHWEPLPGEGSTPSDTPMPSDIQASSGRTPSIKPKTVNLATRPERLLPTESSTAALTSNITDTHDTKQESDSLPPSTLAAEPTTTLQTSVIVNSPCASEQRLLRLESVLDFQELRLEGENLALNNQAGLAARLSQHKQREEPFKAEQDPKPGGNPQEPTKVKQNLTSFFSNIF